MLSWTFINVQERKSWWFDISYGVLLSFSLNFSSHALKRGLLFDKLNDKPATDRYMNYRLRVNWLNNQTRKGSTQPNNTVERSSSTNEL